jgi:3-demethoxyubiquinol 3-hydroxylase
MPDCTVYFDGTCPLCRREIAYYRQQEGASSITWVDAARCESAALGADLDRDIAMARLHARRADGSLVAGVAAFVMIWSRLHAYRWVASMVSRRPILALLERAYAAFLFMRPLWRRPAAAPAALPATVVAARRADHARRAGALQVYRGILAASRDGAVRAFAARRLADEILYLWRIRRCMPSAARSRLLPLWRGAGWLTGATSALLGPRAVFATVAACERWIGRQHASRVERLSLHPQLQAQRATPAARHREQSSLCAAADVGPPVRSGAVAGSWSAIVGMGSQRPIVARRRQ